MRRISLLLASMALSVLLASGVALAINTIKCEGGERCEGTDRRDLMKGDGRDNHMYGRGKGDILKGFAGRDDLLGREGADRLLGGPGIDSLYPGPGNDTLDGGDSVDIYWFMVSNWGQDTITDATLDNSVLLHFSAGSNGPVITRLVSDPLLPEVQNADGTSTINWDDSVIKDVEGSGGDDAITGNDFSNSIQDTYSHDTDNISSAGGDDAISVGDSDGSDTVDCGGGDEDLVLFDQGDTVINCEIQLPNS